MLNRIKKFFSKKDEGVTAIEYALIAALVAVVIIVAVAFLGNSLSGTFSHVGTHVSIPNS